MPCFKTVDVGSNRPDQVPSDISIAKGIDARITLFQVKPSRSRLVSPGKLWAAAAGEKV